MKKGTVVFLFAIGFLLLRNLPLCLLMPLWAHGDEIGHFDYILKLNKGHLPQPTDSIEEELFLLHRGQYDSRYISSARYHIKTPEELGLAQYSYEAQQPPLSYFILSVFRRVFLLFNPSLVLQVKLLRIVSLLAVAFGLMGIYFALRACGIRKIYYYMPLLFIPLLVKDMFFALNIDNFSFLFGSLTLAFAIRLIHNPSANKNWLWFSLSTGLALWVKITNAFLLGLWLPVLFVAWIKTRDKKMVKKALLVLLIVIIFSSPWYLYNLSRQSSAFASLSELPFPNVPKAGLSLSGLRSFFSPFFFTLFRGEFVWNGTHFHALSPKAQYYLLNLIPWFFVLIGFASFFIPVDRENPILFRFLIFSAGLGFFAFYFAQVFIGHAAFYQTRYAFGALYVLVFAFVAGWQRLSPSKEAVLFVPLLGLVIHHVVYTYSLLTRVF